MSCPTPRCGGANARGPKSKCWACYKRQGRTGKEVIEHRVASFLVACRSYVDAQDEAGRESEEAQLAFEQTQEMARHVLQLGVSMARLKAASDRLLASNPGVQRKHGREDAGQMNGLVKAGAPHAQIRRRKRSSAA